MPLRQRIDCPACGVALVRRPAGRCPACGVMVARHVDEARDREERIERFVAVVATVLVVLVSTLTAGRGLLEGALVYAGAGVVMFHLARKTFR